eukprot:gene2327-1462_t
MPKGNNAIPHTHGKKHWNPCSSQKGNVKTFLNQPAQKIRRRRLRLVKAKKVFPRPLKALRPQVNCPTLRHNMKKRLGRGFTPAELTAAGLKPRYAATIGIRVDGRRKNKSEEGLNINVQRLKDYMSKLVLFPINHKKVQKGEASDAECKAAKQDRSRSNVYKFLKKNHSAVRFFGARTARKAKREAAKEATNAFVLLICNIKHKKETESAKVSNGAASELKHTEVGERRWLGGRTGDRLFFYYISSHSEADHSPHLLFHPYIHTSIRTYRTAPNRLFTVYTTLLFRPRLSEDTQISVCFFEINIYIYIYIGVNVEQKMNRFQEFAARTAPPPRPEPEPSGTPHGNEAKKSNSPPLEQPPAAVSTTFLTPLGSQGLSPPFHLAEPSGDPIVPGASAAAVRAPPSPAGSRKMGPSSSSIRKGPPMHVSALGASPAPGAGTSRVTPSLAPAPEERLSTPAASTTAAPRPVPRPSVAGDQPGSTVAADPPPQVVVAALPALPPPPPAGSPAAAPSPRERKTKGFCSCFGGRDDDDDEEMRQLAAAAIASQQQQIQHQQQQQLPPLSAPAPPADLPAPPVPPPPATPVQVVADTPAGPTPPAAPDSASQSLAGSAQGEAAPAVASDGAALHRPHRVPKRPAAFDAVTSAEELTPSTQHILSPSASATPPTAAKEPRQGRGDRHHRSEDAQPSPASASASASTLRRTVSTASRSRGDGSASPHGSLCDHHPCRAGASSPPHSYRREDGLLHLPHYRRRILLDLRAREREEEEAMLRGEEWRELTFQPRINRRSRHYAATEPPQGSGDTSATRRRKDDEVEAIFNRLYMHQTRHVANTTYMEPETYSFTPEITAKAQRLGGGKNVVERLYPTRRRRTSDASGETPSASSSAGGSPMSSRGKTWSRQHTARRSNGARRGPIHFSDLDESQRPLNRCSKYLALSHDPFALGTAQSWPQPCHRTPFFRAVREPSVSITRRSDPYFDDDENFFRSPSSAPTRERKGRGREGRGEGGRKHPFAPTTDTFASLPVSFRVEKHTFDTTPDSPFPPIPLLCCQHSHTHICCGICFTTAFGLIRNHLQCAGCTLSCQIQHHPKGN